MKLVEHEILAIIIFLNYAGNPTRSLKITLVNKYVGFSNKLGTSPKHSKAPSTNGIDHSQFRQFRRQKIYFPFHGSRLCFRPFFGLCVLFGLNCGLRKISLIFMLYVVFSTQSLHCRLAYASFYMFVYVGQCPVVKFIQFPVQSVFI